MGDFFKEDSLCRATRSIWYTWTLVGMYLESARIVIINNYKIDKSQQHEQLDHRYSNLKFGKEDIE